MCRPTIAIVNNEPSLRKAWRMHLEHAGFNVRTYAKTSEALELIAEPTDLVLMDRHNPPLGGIELFKRLRSATTMRLVFLSAMAELAEQELARDGLSADAYIPLPTRLVDIENTVRAVLDK